MDTYAYQHLKTASISDLKWGRQLPTIAAVYWLIGGLTLVVVGVVLHRVLGMGHRGNLPAVGLGYLPGDLQDIYQPLAQEIEAHSAILGIILNDAFGERQADRAEMAWGLVRLAVGEWERLTAVVVGLQGILSKFLPATTGIFPVHCVTRNHFMSRAVTDNVRLYEFLDQALYSSKRRFALQLRLLSRSSAILSKEFMHTFREGALTLNCSLELWTRLDRNFHDFDLIAKETLLAFRTLLLCQSPEAVQELAMNLQVLLAQGLRASVSVAQR
ncbi:MAG: hypothetical protein WAO35_08635 [Terriglobia bacterium]